MITADIKTKIEIIKYLEHLGNHPYAMPKYKRLGICDALQYRYGISWHELRSYFKSWPEYSGFPNFPVGQAGEGSLSAPLLYTANETLKWSTCAYGKARRRLCLHIAAEMRKETGYYA